MVMKIWGWTVPLQDILYGVGVVGQTGRGMIRRHYG